MLVSVCCPKDSNRLKLPDKMVAEVLVGQRCIFSVRVDLLIMACQSNLGSTLNEGWPVCVWQASFQQRNKPAVST